MVNTWTKGNRRKELKDFVNWANSQTVLNVYLEVNWTFNQVGDTVISYADGVPVSAARNGHRITAIRFKNPVKEDTLISRLFKDEEVSDKMSKVAQKILDIETELGVKIENYTVSYGNVTF